MLVETQFFPDEKIAKVTLNGPFYNLLSSKLLQQLFSTLRDINSQFPKYGCIILTGSKGTFCAGASIREFNDEKKSAFVQNYDEISGFFYKDMVDFPVPVIAVVDGFALGGGFELLLSSDIILCTKKLKFGLPETKLGILPGFGGTQRLTQIVGKYKAMEFILTNKFISGEELVQYKIANYSYDSPELLEKAAWELALKISSASKYANKYARLSINQSLPLQEGSKFEGNSFKELFKGKDRVIGVQAFLNGTKAKF